MNREQTLVYIIAVTHCGEPVSPCKVGIAANAATRLSQLQTASPQRLMIFKSFVLPSRQIAKDVEHCFHACQVGYRLKGEWFRIEPETVARLLCLQIRMMLDMFTDLEPWEYRAIYSSIGVAG